MIKILLLCAQVFSLTSLAPGVSGFIRKIKNNLRMRKGPGVLQPYYNFAKLISKGQVISKQASWIFNFTPIIVLASSICACFLIPVFQTRLSLNRAGDLLAILFLFALGRFFLALSALDAGSSFGGMGSSREMFISCMAEPAAFTAIFVLGMNSGSLSMIGRESFLRASTILAGIAIFLLALAETSRIPVDNQETHLELTMVHEAMVLEYSGWHLALIELSSHIRQMIFFALISLCAFPMLLDARWQGLEFLARVIIIAICVAVVEVSMAKMRLFRVVDYLGFALFVALLAAVASAIGM